jgi:hypothetical protein
MFVHLRCAVAVACVALGVALAAADEKKDEKKDDNKLPDAIKAVLDKADSLEIYSLDPSLQLPVKDKEKEPEKDPKDKFNGWKVLGKTVVKDKPAKDELLTALYKGVKDNEGVVAACFIPRHGIRATADGKTVDLVICFQCLQIYCFVDGKREGGCLVTRSPQPAFDKVLKDANVPLAPK